MAEQTSQSDLSSQSQQTSQPDLDPEPSAVRINGITANISCDLRFPHPKVSGLVQSPPSQFSSIISI